MLFIKTISIYDEFDCSEKKPCFVFRYSTLLNTENFWHIDLGRNLSRVTNVRLRMLKFVCWKIRLFLRFSTLKGWKYRTNESLSLPPMLYLCGLCFFFLEVIVCVSGSRVKFGSRKVSKHVSENTKWKKWVKTHFTLFFLLQ